MILSGLPQAVVATQTMRICDFPGNQASPLQFDSDFQIIVCDILYVNNHISAYQMRYGDLCEEKMFDAKIKYGNARVLELLWAMKILEVMYRCQ